MAITPVLICGAECGNVDVGATGGTPHWSVVTGTTTVDATVFRSAGAGLRSYKFTSAAGAQIDLRHTLPASQAHAVARGYLNLNPLPSADCIVACAGTAAGAVPAVFFKASDSKIYASVGLTTGASGVLVTAGTWYRIDYHGDVSGGTRTCDVSVDGTACGQASAAIAASTFDRMRIGGNCAADINSTTANYTLWWDDLIVSVTAGDFPIGAGTVKGLRPNADGSHNFNLAGDFKYENTTNVAVGATDTWTHVDDLLDNITDFISAVGAAAGEYVEWAFDDLGTDVQSVNGLEVVASFHSAGTQANKTTLRIVDGATTSDVLTDADLSQTTRVMNTKTYAVAPSTSAAWTKAKVDALLARFNSSYTTVDESPVPSIDAIVLEVDYVQTQAAFVRPMIEVAGQSVMRSATF